MDDKFKLIIDIRGLCLLVGNASKMHVLIPKTPPGPPHTARITFESKYSTTGSPTHTTESFDGVRWDLSTLVNTGVTAGIPEDVVPNVSKVVNHKGMPRKHLRPGEQQKLSSELVLGAGRFTCHGQRAYWDVDCRGVWMTNKIRWQIDEVPGTRLDWSFGPLNGTGRTPPPLRPVGGQIVIDLMNAPPPEHASGDTGVGCAPHVINHFDLYYELLDLPSGSLRPKAYCTNVEVEPPYCPAEPGMFPPLFLPGPSVFTCMLGQTHVDPNS